MVSFIYIGWTAHIQYNYYINFGGFAFTPWNTGEPIVVAFFFYGLKQLALYFRSLRDMEKDRKENPSHYE